MKHVMITYAKGNGDVATVRSVASDKQIRFLLDNPNVYQVFALDTHQLVTADADSAGIRLHDLSLDLVKPLTIWREIMKS